MAAIDKIYGTTEQYDEFRAWCERNLLPALKYFYERDGYVDGKSRPITNFPSYIDATVLRIGTAPEWVVARIKDQYSSGLDGLMSGKTAADDLHDLKITPWGLDREMMLIDLFIQLGKTAWEGGDEFTIRRPWGHDDWKWQIYAAMADVGFITAEKDGDGHWQDIDTRTADMLIIEMLDWAVSEE